jgi:hypothetical protein
MRRSTLLILAVITALFLASGAAVALTSVVSGGAINQVKVARSDEGVLTDSNSYVDVPGATVQVNVPAGTRALLLARFSAEAQCDTPQSGRCSVRIVAVRDGSIQELQPSREDADFAGADGLMGSHSIDRSLLVNSGTYNVKAQYKAQAFIAGDPIFLALHSRSLTVERAKA